MKVVFTDAFYFVGLLDREDQHHARIVAAARELRDDILTTGWILAEFADAMAKSASRRLVFQFIRDLEQDSKVRMIHASTELFRRGLRLYNDWLAKEWSLTDCISFVAMKHEELVDILTGDKRFVQAGFNILFQSSSA